jgi:hypothetical protein
VRRACDEARRRARAASWFAGLLLVACSGSSPSQPDAGGASGNGMTAAGAGAGAGGAGSPASGAGGAAAGSGGMPASMGSGGTAPVTDPSGKDGGADSGKTGAGVVSGLPAPDLDRLLEAGCATSTMRSELLPSNMLFVIDRSASMACNPPPTTDSTTCEMTPERVSLFSPSKWEITRMALSNAIKALPDDTVVGISYFSNDDACGVHSLPSVPLMALAESQRSAIESSLSNVEPDGATPLVGATILAYRHLHDLSEQKKLRGKMFVVLLTDGEQSEPCTDAERCSSAASCTKLLVEDEVPKAASPEVGIRTFVIGAPGSEPARTVLSQIAKNGGTAPAGCDVAAGTCHFDMTVRTQFDTALADALSQISGRALSCELSLPEGDDDVDRQRVNVVYSPADGSAPVLIVQDDRAGCDDGANGWQYTADAKKIRLCGAACEAVRADHGARVDVVLGCLVRGPE